MSNLLTIEKSCQIFQSMQCNFSHEVASVVFSHNIEHFWAKWLNTRENMITFLSSLDIFNRKAMLDWGSTLIS